MNEVITYGQNYGLTKGIKIFAKSSKRVDATTTVLGLNLKDDAIQFLKDNGFNYVDVKPLAEKHGVNLSLSPYTLKVILFYLYVKNVSTADNVFLCDFTDIFFQKNIFIEKRNKATVFTEGELIGNCPTNSTWINLCYNQDIFGLLKNKEIINGGAILGPRNKCVDLLKEMCLDSSVVIAKIGNYQNIDQAILNKVVYFDAPTYEICGPSFVLNMAHHDKKTPIRVESDYINTHIKAYGSIPAVVHQYDVNKEIEKFINEDFGK
jgi:hypothetical protein